MIRNLESTDKLVPTVNRFGEPFPCLCSWSCFLKDNYLHRDIDFLSALSEEVRFTADAPLEWVLVLNAGEGLKMLFAIV